MEIKLGDKVRDSITGFEGTATARVEYINGCVQFCVTPRVDKDGKSGVAEYVDYQRLEVVEAATEPVVLQSFPLRADGGKQNKVADIKSEWNDSTRLDFLELAPSYVVLPQADYDSRRIGEPTLREIIDVVSTRRRHAVGGPQSNPPSAGYRG